MFNINGFRQAKQRFYFPKMMILIIEFSGLLLAKKYNSSNYVHARESGEFTLQFPAMKKNRKTVQQLLF
jgi:hypothetical protein